MRALNSLLFIFLVTSFAFTQHSDKEIQILNARIDSLENELMQLKKELNKTDYTETILSTWLESNFGVIVPEEKQFPCSFDCKMYANELSKSIQAEFKEEYWLGTYLFNGIFANEDGIEIDLSTDDLTKTLILTENYFTVSYHPMMGSDGQTLIYNFKEQKSKLDSEIFVIRPLSPTLLLVGKDYYDSRDVEDPEYEGHIFEKGTFNLETGEYLFLERE